jgi:hypothetical protein
LGSAGDGSVTHTFRSVVALGFFLFAAAMSPCIGQVHAQQPIPSEYAQPQIADGLSHEHQQVLEALAAAYRRAGSVGIDLTESAVVISRRGHLIVVLFTPQQPNVRDGQAEFTYDARQGKIIRERIDG